MVAPQPLPTDEPPHHAASERDHEDQTPALTRTARKVIVGTVGGTVTAVGIVFLPLPGPGTPIIIAGLAILATEFDSAKRQLDRLKKAARNALRKG